MQRRSLLLVAPRRLEWIAEELPEVGSHDLLVQTTSGAISIGTEVPQFAGVEREIVERSYPRMTGYESVGVVVARGTRVRSVAIGERVVAFYGHRTHALVPAARAIRVPSHVSDALALLAILSCDAAKGVRTMRPRPDEPALITGMGTMGLLTLFVLSAYGVRQVDVVEPQPPRLALALRLGAGQALSPEQIPPEAKYAVGFECSSRDAAFALLQRCMTQGGRICVLADGNVEPLTLAPAFHARELRLAASSDGWNYQRHAHWYFERVCEGMPELEALFQEQVTADALPQTFARLADGERAPVKVLVRYSSPT
jgi:alcohol dehydrogenase